MMHRPLKLLVLVAAALLSSIAVADDLQPPPWRGEPNTAFVEWQRQPGPTGQLVITQEAYPDGGFPLFVGDPDGGSGPIQPGGNAQIIGIQPITPNGAIYDIYVPNVVDPLPVKLWHIQITYELPAQDPGPGPKVEVIDGAPIIDQIDPLGPSAQQVFTPGQPGDPTLVWELWEGVIFPNPDWEIFQISVPGQLEQIVIDTVSIPEPATMLTLLIGTGVAAVRRRN